MCRNIRTLYNFEPPAEPAEVQAAALQFVRKISGFTIPSQVNEAIFTTSVNEIARVAQRLIDNLQTSAPAKDRLVEASKAKTSSAKRFEPFKT